MSPDPILSAIDSVLDEHSAIVESMKRNAARFDPFAVGGVDQDQAGKVYDDVAVSPSAMRWMGDRETATGRGWVSPAGTQYARDNTVTGYDPCHCDHRCPHGQQCLGSHQGGGHWYADDPCTPMRTITIEQARRLPQLLREHSERHHLDPDPDCPRCLDALGYAVPDDLGPVLPPALAKPSWRERVAEWFR